MTFINKLITAAVLTSPLWLILILLLLAIWIAVKAAKRFERPSVKGAVGLLVFLVVFFMPFGDEIAGRGYLNYLCGTQAGVKVYETVELPAEYWDEQGRPRFYLNSDQYGKTRYIFPDKTIEEPRFAQRENDGRYSQFFYIHKRVSSLTERESGKTFAEVIRFRFWGGWISQNFSPHNNAISCEKPLNGWQLSIFKRGA